MEYHGDEDDIQQEQRDLEERRKWQKTEDNE